MLTRKRRRELEKFSPDDNKWMSFFDTYTKSQSYEINGLSSIRNVKEIFNGENLLVYGESSDGPANQYKLIILNPPNNKLKLAVAASCSIQCDDFSTCHLLNDSSTVIVFNQKHFGTYSLTKLKVTKVNNHVDIKDENNVLFLDSDLLKSDIGGSYCYDIDDMKIFSVACFRTFAFVFVVDATSRLKVLNTFKVKHNLGVVFSVSYKRTATNLFLSTAQCELIILNVNLGTYQTCQVNFLYQSFAFEGGMVAKLFLESKNTEYMLLISAYGVIFDPQREKLTDIKELLDIEDPEEENEIDVDDEDYEFTPTIYIECVEVDNFNNLLYIFDTGREKVYVYDAMVEKVVMQFNSANSEVIALSHFGRSIFITGDKNKLTVKKTYQPSTLKECCRQSIFYKFSKNEILKMDLGKNLLHFLLDGH